MLSAVKELKLLSFIGNILEHWVFSIILQSMVG